jgi:RNA methyltransferase, TrmH family
MKLLTLARDLRRRKARERQDLFVAEGVRTVEELLRSDFEVRGALVSPAADENSRSQALLAQFGHRDISVEQVSAEDFASAADTDSPQGILAIARVPKRSLADIPSGDTVRLLVLDAIQDPGNVGTILRTAGALKATATFSLPGTVDLWNAKVVRSGMGAHFHHPCLSGTWDDLDAFRRDRSISLWAADAGGESIEGLGRPARIALVVGNEGSGLSSAARQRADRIVALPIADSTESLNVAVATGILLYELRR